MIKSLYYNFLSALNVLFGFLFVIFLGKKFGIGSDTDIYFLCVVIIAYIGYFVQSCWEAMSPYYVQSIIKNKELSYKLFSILLNDILLISFVIICIYFIVSVFVNLPLGLKNFMNIFIFYLLLQNVLFYNKSILNLHHYYAQFYITDIFVYAVLFFGIVFCEANILYIAVFTVIATFIAVIFQLYLIFFKIGIKYRFVLYDNKFNEIYLQSIKLKLGSIVFGTKDIIIASLFLGFGAGVYSIYNYASKFASSVLAIINSPMLNIFATKVNFLIAQDKISDIFKEIKSLLYKTTFLYIATTGVIYFLIPFVFEFLLKDKLQISQIYQLQNIFLILGVIYFNIVFQSPYGRLLSAKKLNGIALIINLIFLFLVYIASIVCNQDYYIFFAGYFVAYLFYMVSQIWVWRKFCKE